MRPFRFVIVVLLCLFTCTSVSIAETSPQQAEVKSPTGAAVRSALFPGWGQFYNRKPLKGSLFLCAESFLLTQIVLEERCTQDNASSRGRRNTLILWWAGIKLYAIIDAYIDAHLYGLNRKEVPLAIGVIPGLGTDRVMLFCQFCF